MTLPDPTPLFEDSGEDPHDSPTSSDDLTHVSEVLAANGIPVADSLKERMMDDLARLVEEEAVSERESEPRRSA